METSMLLSIRPDLVDMSKAVREYRPGSPMLSASGQPKVTMGGRMDTHSGIHGDAALATSEKGVIALEAIARDLQQFIEHFLEMPNP
jgi:creatinine amidohydrolase